jgi:hypothetical protein
VAQRDSESRQTARQPLGGRASPADVHRPRRVAELGEVTTGGGGRAMRALVEHLNSRRAQVCLRLEGRLLLKSTRHIPAHLSGGESAARTRCRFAFPPLQAAIPANEIVNAEMSQFGGPYLNTRREGGIPSARLGELTSFALVASDRCWPRDDGLSNKNRGDGEPRIRLGQDERWLALISRFRQRPLRC